MAAPTRTPVHEFINQLRRYDGTTNVTEFMTRFVQDLAVNGYNSAWGIRNFDRVLDSDAKSWFNSVWPQYDAAYTRCAADADYDALLQRIADDMIAMFDH